MVKQDILLINYTSCNWDSILLVTFIIPIMICLIVIMKIISFGEYYHSQNIPVPIFFHFGDRRMVKNVVEQIIQSKQNKASINPAEGFESNHELGKYYSIQDFIEYIFTEASSAKQLFIRITNTIMGINSCATTFYDEGREKIITESTKLNSDVFLDFIDPLLRKSKVY